MSEHEKDEQQSVPAFEPTQNRFGAESVVTTGGETADQKSSDDTSDETTQDDDATISQEELDAMVDYTITEETLEEFNASLEEGMTPFKVGDVVKLAKDHPILATQAQDEAAE